MSNKITRIEIRITPEEKEKIKKYTEQHNITISKLFREFLQNLVKDDK